MGFDQTDMTVKILHQGSAVLDPVTAIHVDQVVQWADLGLVNVAANDAPDPALAGHLQHRILKLCDKLHR